MITKKIIISIAVSSICISTLSATSIKDVVEHTISNNPDIASKNLNNEAFRKYVDEEKGGYYPRVDFTATFGIEDEDIDYDDGTPDSDESKTGATYQLDAEQLIYDGNLTSGRVDEATARYNSNKFKNSAETENIIFNGIKSYLDVLRFDERLTNAKETIDIYEDYLLIAKDTENISGEILDKVQTSAKIRYATNAFLEETINKKTALSSFKKNVRMSLDSNICKPKLDESVIPSTLKDLVNSTLLTNYTILEQVENIKEQQATLTQENADFLPTLKFKLQGTYSDELLDDDAETEFYSAKLELKYNLYNGGSDKAATQREEIFVKEAQKRLDVVTNDVVDEVSVAYETYNTSKKQVKEITQYIKDNEQILSIYKDQFEGGTRTFIDVLNIEVDIYNAKIILANTEFQMYEAYYQVLNSQSKLQSTVLSGASTTCSNTQSTTTTVSTATEPTKETNDLDEVRNALEDSSGNEVIQNNTVYALFIESYRDLSSAQKALNKVDEKMNYSLKSKILSNKNGTFTTVLYDVPTKDEVIAAKNTLNSKFPASYYRKLKKK